MTQTVGAQEIMVGIIVFVQVKGKVFGHLL